MKKNLLETTFPTFPEFREITLEDRDTWEELVAEFPPYCSLSFGEIMTWWGNLGYAKASHLNDNLVICYWFFGDEEASGLCLVGNKQIDESICEIFDWQKQTGRRARIVHVPEFVMSLIKFPEMYRISTEPGYDECVLSAKSLVSFDDLSPYKKSKLRQMFANVDEERITIDRLNLGAKANQDLLIDLTNEWVKSGKMNNPATGEVDILKSTIRTAEELGYENACMYINGELHSFILYQLPSDPKFVMVNYIRLSYAFPGMFELAAYTFAKFFLEQGIEYANIENDMDIPVLRNTKLNLGPTNFLRKYTIEPRESKK